MDKMTKLKNTVGNDMVVSVVRVGFLDVNCYLVYCPSSGTLLVVDPGAEADKIVEAARKEPFSRAAVLLTHGHVDHIGAVGEVARELRAEYVYLHPADIGLYRSPDNHLMPYVPAASGLPETVGELAEDGVAVLHTPGHTRGAVCFHLPAVKTLLSGDTLFAGSIGRTDLPGGDFDVLKTSISTRLLPLADDTKVLAGHGRPSTIGEEKSSNPFL